MRHYMVDPDNEERLLKIPPSVVAEIQAAALQQAREERLRDTGNGIRAIGRYEGLRQAREAVQDAQRKVPIDPLSDNWRTDIEHRLDIINVIDALMEEQ